MLRGSYMPNLVKIGRKLAHSVGRSRRMDGHQTDERMEGHAKVNLYSVECIGQTITNTVA